MCEALAVETLVLVVSESKHSASTTGIATQAVSAPVDAVGAKQASMNTKIMNAKLETKQSKLI